MVETIILLSKDIQFSTSNQSESIYWLIIQATEGLGLGWSWMKEVVNEPSLQSRLQIREGKPSKKA